MAGISRKFVEIIEQIQCDYVRNDLGYTFLVYCS